MATMLKKISSNLEKMTQNAVKSLKNVVSENGLEIISSISKTSKDEMTSSIHPIAPGENGFLLDLDGKKNYINSPDGENIFVLDKKTRHCIPLEEGLKNGWLPIDVRTQILNQTTKIHVDTIREIEKVYDLGQMAMKKNTAQLKQKHQIKTSLTEKAQKEVSLIDTTTFSATQKLSIDGFETTHALKFGFTVEQTEEPIKSKKRTLKKDWPANIKTVKVYYKETFSVSDGISSYEVKINNSLKGKAGNWQSTFSTTTKNEMSEILFPEEKYFNSTLDHFIDESWKTTSNLAIDVLHHNFKVGELNSLQNLVGTHPIEFCLQNNK